MPAGGLHGMPRANSFDWGTMQSLTFRRPMTMMRCGVVMSGKA